MVTAGLLVLRVVSPQQPSGRDSWSVAGALVQSHVLWPQHVGAAGQGTIRVTAAVERGEVGGADLDDGWQHALGVVLA